MSESIVRSGSENSRLGSLFKYQVLDSLPEKEYDSITRLASYICNKPISTITFLDNEFQFIKSQVGMNGGKSRLTGSICQLTIQDKQILEIRDTLKDPRSSGLACVTGDPNVRFYAGAPLISPEGYVLGTLCVIDIVPGELDERQKQALTTLADEVMSHLEARRKNIVLNDLILKYEEINTMFNSSAELHCILERDGKIRVMNNVVEGLLGYTLEEVLGHPVWEFFYEEDMKAMIPLLEKGLGSGKKQFELEGRIKLRDGTTKWMGWSITVKNDKWYASGRDISDQKNMIAELEQLSLVANKVNNGVIISDNKSHVI